MKAIFFLIAIVPTSLFAQSTEHVHIIKDTSVSVAAKSWPYSHSLQKGILLSDGQIINSASKLTLGKGSLPNGDFNYIATPSNSMEAKLKHTTTLKQIEVREIRKKGDKKFGYTYIIVCESHYLVQLDDAIASGEIILSPTESKESLGRK